MDRIVSFVDEALGNSSYLVDCGDGRALVVDPVRDVGQYESVARQRGLTIAFALETHLHADFVSGAHVLSAGGVQVVAPAGAALEFPYRALGDGDHIEAGDLVIRAIATPGHTPEHLSYLILRGGIPSALLSGGALLPGTVARTDLIAPERTESLARELHRAVRTRIAPLPDGVAVYPTHGGGSFCAAGASPERTTTIGRERTANPVFTADEDTFVKDLIAGLGTYPPYFLRLREVNRRGPAIDRPPSLPRVSVGDTERLVRGGAHLVDVRPVLDWADAHIPGSLAIALRPAFASWLGWLVEPGRPLLFVLGDEQDRGDLIRACRSIGYDDLAGELDGGIDAWRDAGRPVARITTTDDPIVDGPVLDVRQDREFAAGHLPGALHIELGSLPAGSAAMPGALPDALTVMCGHGERAATAASLLERAGHGDVRVLLAGAGDWRRATGRALETGE
ncbi:MAG TPA: rhodanese-like domain-containing protein [Actinomycetota bacterium]